MRRRLLLFLLPVALVACDESPTPLTAPDALRVQDPSGAPRDAGIVSDDSWFSAVVTTTTDGVSSSANIEGGYGSGGELRFGVYWNHSGPSGSFAGIRYVGDRVEMLNAAGTIISSNTFNGHATDIGLPGGTLVGALILTQDPGDGTCDPSAPGCLATVLADPAARAMVQRGPDERRVRQRARPAPTAVAMSGEGDYADVERVFRRVPQPGGAPDLWRLEEISEERRATTDDGPRVTRSTTKVRYTRYRINAPREAARVAAFRAAPPPPVTATAVSTPSVHESVAPSEADDAEGILDPYCIPGTRNDHLQRGKYTVGLSIIYQHGFCSDAAAFDGYRPRIAASILVSRERAYSLNSTLSIEAQVSELRTRIAAGGPSRNIIVGHSQGGLVARRFGQVAPEYVSGVVTIGTPQGGSLLAALGPDAIEQLVDRMTNEMCATAFLCDLIGGILQEQAKGRLSVALLDNGAPSLADMVPESPFLNTLNSTYESFARASVETDVKNRWAIARMIGDARSPVTGLATDQRPGGDAWVTRAQNTYSSAQALKYLSMFTLFYRHAFGNGVDCTQGLYMSYWEPCAGQVAGMNNDLDWYQSALAFGTLIITSLVTETMDAIDRAWDYGTTRGFPGTDGLIHTASQRYPDAPGRFAPERYRSDGLEADSHAGQLASPTTLQRTVDAVRSLAAKNP